MTETCLGDGVCTNPTCPTHGIEWTAKVDRRDVVFRQVLALDNEYAKQTGAHGSILAFALSAALAFVPEQELLGLDVRITEYARELAAEARIAAPKH